jgi:hypothetical protein
MSFFERKQATETVELDDVYDLANPIPSAIVVTFSIVESKLDASQHWARQAHDALKAGDLQKWNGFLCLAKKSAEQAVALMESAGLLHEETLNQQ